MTNVKIGNKTIAFPPDMKDRDLEKAIRQLRIDFAAEAAKDLKPTITLKDARSNKKKGGRVMKARGGRVMRRKWPK